MSSFHQERVLSVRHWTDRLFSFRTTRTPSFRFGSGQFVMMGLQVDGRPLLRAYSLASAHYDDELEFFSIKVPDGPLTSRLQHLKEGDEVLVGRKPTGTLVARRSAARPEPLPARHGDRPRAVLEHRPGPGDLRALRADRARARRAQVDEPRLCRLPRRRAAERRPSSASMVRDEAHLLPDGDARAVPQPGPHPDLIARRQAVRATSACRRSTRRTTASCSAAARRC